MTDELDAQRFRLISGVFYPDEANQLLMTLIEDKISFHQRNNWSRRERFGETDAAGNEAQYQRQHRYHVDTQIGWGGRGQLPGRLHTGR